MPMLNPEKRKAIKSVHKMFITMPHGQQLGKLPFW